MRQGLWDRRLGGRGERKSPLTRFGAPASARIAPAPSQVEQPRGAEATRRRGLPAAALVLAASFAAGLGGGISVAEAAVFIQLLWTNELGIADKVGAHTLLKIVA